HRHVLAQEDAGHATRPEVLQQLVLAGDDEAAPLALEELPRLKGGQQAVADHGLGQLGRRGRQRRCAAAQVAVEVLRVEDAALARDLEEVIGRDGGRHTADLPGARGHGRDENSTGPWRPPGKEVCLTGAAGSTRELCPLWDAESHSFVTERGAAVK